MSTLLKLGLSGYDVKPRFGEFQCEYLLQNPLFFLGKNFGNTKHPYEKNEPTLDHSGGGVHGKACWLIAYMNHTLSDVSSTWLYNDIVYTIRQYRVQNQIVYKTLQSM